MEVLRYSTSNVAMQSKYATECLIYTWDCHLCVYSTCRYSRSRSQERQHSYRKKSRSHSPKSRRSHSRSPVPMRPHSPRSKRSRSRSPDPRSRSKSPPPHRQETKTSSSEKKIKYGQSLSNITSCSANGYLYGFQPSFMCVGLECCVCLVSFPGCP